MPTPSTLTRLFFCPKEETMSPAPSKAVRRAMAIAEHEPDKLYKRNRGMRKMSKQELSDFASTKEKDLPMHVLPTGLKKIRSRRR